MLFGVSAAVVVFVLALMAVSIVRRHRRAEGDPDRDEPRWGDRFIVVGGVVVSGAVLLAVFILSLHEMAALATPPTSPAADIQVIGHLWWWEARYPNGAVTANEIHIPVGRAVEVDLTTADVIHSFWVPQLQVKLDQIPGRTNRIWLQADSAGRYRGQCSQFCGLQHAHMVFWVVAEEPAAYQQWVDAQAQPAAAPIEAAATRGKSVFDTTTCVGCHAIRGTTAQGGVGPDLTHLMGRQTIAAGTVPNTPDQLAAWITDPQGIKPGVIMPPTALSPGDLADLVAYLQSLQ